MNFSLSFQLSLIVKTQARDYDIDINRPRASLYIIWKGFHWRTSVSSSGTLSSCVYMIPNIWMKTEKKIINLDWKQNRSTNLSAWALGILNAELIPTPQE